MWLVIGAVMGSVANALIYRLPRKKSWVKGQSICPRCGRGLRWYDLIPLLSYLFLGGKCRYCKKPIGLRYFLVELILAIGFALIFNFKFSILNHYSIINVLILQAILFVTVVIAAMDWETMLVSDWMVVAWAILVFGYQLSAGQLSWSGLTIGIVAGVGTIGGIWALSRGRAMGFGDVEIAAVMGLWLNWPKVIYAMWIAFVSGAIVGVYLLMKKKKKLKSQLAFGTFLILGTWVAYIVDWSHVFSF